MTTESKPSIHALSKRQRQVAISISEGKCYKNIAGALQISESTVCNHVQNIYRRLNIANHEQLIAFVRAHIDEPKPDQRLLELHFLTRWLEYARDAEQRGARGSSKMVEELSALIVGTATLLPDCMPMMSRRTVK